MALLLRALCLIIVVLPGFAGPPEEIRVLVLKQALGADLKPSKQYAELIKGVYYQLASLPRNVKIVWADVDNQAEIQSYQQTQFNYLVCLGTRAALVGLDRFKGIPMLYSMVLNPEDMGFDEATLNKKAGVVGGILARIAPKDYMEAIRKAHPSIRKVGLLYGSEIYQEYTAQIVEEGARREIQVLSQRVSSNKSLVPQYKELVDSGIELFLMIPDTRFFAKTHQYILQESYRHKIPVLGLSEPYIKAGSLWGLVLSPEAIGKQTVEMLKNVLEKKRVSIEYPRQNRLILNPIVAKKLNLSFPDVFLQEANQISSQVE